MKLEAFLLACQRPFLAQEFECRVIPLCIGVLCAAASSVWLTPSLLSSSASTGQNCQARAGKSASSSSQTRRAAARGFFCCCLHDLPHYQHGHFPAPWPEASRQHFTAASAGIIMPYFALVRSCRAGICRPAADARWGAPASAAATTTMFLDLHASRVPP